MWWPDLKCDVVQFQPNQYVYLYFKSQLEWLTQQITMNILFFKHYAVKSCSDLNHVLKVWFIWQSAVWMHMKPTKSTLVLQFHCSIRVPDIIIITRIDHFGQWHNTYRHPHTFICNFASMHYPNGVEIKHSMHDSALIWVVSQKYALPFKMFVWNIFWLK